MDPPRLHHPITPPLRHSPLLRHDLCITSLRLPASDRSPGRFVQRRFTGSRPHGWCRAAREGPCHAGKETVMSLLLGLGILFLIVSVLAYALGARGTAAASAGVGRTFLFIFLILAVLFIIAGIVGVGPRLWG